MAVDTADYRETIRDLKLTSMLESECDAPGHAAMELEIRLGFLRRTLSPAAAELLDEWLDWANECP